MFLRFKSFPRNLCSRSSKNCSSDSKLDPRNLALELRKSKLETLASKLDSQFLKTLRIENRVSSRDCQLTCTFEHYCVIFSLKYSHSTCTLFALKPCCCCRTSSKFARCYSSSVLVLIISSVMELVPDVPSSTWLIRYDAKHYLVILKQAHVSVDCEILRRNPPDVGVTSGQKPCTKIIYIVL